ncbi:ImmA/IrrE family metallo-endopeptidase [Exiguobacterium aurantiacum]|uniref:ImmA/IrrE family metallo-endopeptidase n=1 Tax=Exiguobacterium aurantiacum TaxID=33987 RepID=UPI00385047CC
MNELTIEDIQLLNQRVNEQLGRLNLTNQIVREQIFRILQNETTFMQYPIEDDELCAFVCKKQGRLFAYINSYIPHDKQIFAAAHELYHIWYEEQRLNEVELLMNQTLEEEPAERSEKMANRFAAMFLVPELVLRQQLSSLQIDHETIDVKDIVKLIPIFQVPYKTIVLRLFEIAFISEKQCHALLAIPDRDPTQGVVYQMKVLQLPLDSQQRSNNIMLDGYIEHVLEAYRNEKISYMELREYLALSNRTPGDFGYPVMTADDLAMLLEDCDD